MQINLPENSHIYGFGAVGDALDKACQCITIWGKDSYPQHTSIPFFIYGAPPNNFTGVLIECTEKVLIDAKPNNVLEITATEPSGAGAKMREFTGTIPEILQHFFGGKLKTTFPDWAFGFAQSRYSYASAAKVLEIATTFIEKGLPLSAIYLDVHYMNHFRPFTWNKKRFANPAALTAELANLGIKTITILDPAVKTFPFSLDFSQLYPFPFRPAQKVKAWAGTAILPDFENGDVQAWWAKKVRETLLENGVAGVWIDMNEPACMRRKSQTAPIPHHNRYPLKMAQATAKSGVPFILSRGAFFGQGQYSAVWTGDCRSTWSDLAESITRCLSLGLSGVPFCGADVGGFLGDATPELYIRWLQFGAFSPLFRAHSDIKTKPHEPWSFGAEAEHIARKFLRIRKDFLPYITEEFKDLAKIGQPLMRPMFLDFPQDERSWRETTQYMFGRSYLVAPILRHGARSRPVWLPDGEWKNVWTGEFCQGNVWADAPLDIIPVFERM